MAVTMVVKVLEMDVQVLTKKSRIPVTIPVKKEAMPVSYTHLQAKADADCTPDVVGIQQNIHPNCNDDQH